MLIQQEVWARHDWHTEKSEDKQKRGGRIGRGSGLGRSTRPCRGTSTSTACAASWSRPPGSLARLLSSDRNRLLAPERNHDFKTFPQDLSLKTVSSKRCRRFVGNLPREKPKKTHRIAMIGADGAASDRPLFCSAGLREVSAASGGLLRGGGGFCEPAAALDQSSAEI